jgi:hypothetical protein
MTISRRDFMKLFGVGVASVLMTRCRFPVVGSCYAPMPLPTSTLSSARERLRRFWLSFNELAQKTLKEADQGGTENTFGRQLTTGHRLALDELVASGELTAPVSGLVQEAYDAAVFHVWRSNAPITCYAPSLVNYAPLSASVLVRQSEILSTAAAGGAIDPATLATAQAAIEHDMAYYSLSDADLQTLYDQIMQDIQASGQSAPAFEDLPLKLTPDARAAAQFIIDLLSGK